MHSAQTCPPGPSLALLDAVQTPAAALIPRRGLLAPLSSAELHVAGRNPPGDVLKLPWPFTATNDPGREASPKGR